MSNIKEIQPVNITDRFHQDDEGQWWYTLSFNKPHLSRTKAIIRKCLHCKQPYLVTKYRLKDKGRSGEFCSRNCGTKARGGHKFKTGSDSHRWKGGRRKARGGYIEIYCPEHPSLKGTKRKYVREHRLVMEKKIGRYLESWEEVHHLNAIRDDNRPENLELWVKSHPAGARYTEAVKHCPTCTCSKHNNLT